jgi:hypothetical protein
MPTLHHRVRKKEKANTKTAAVKKAATLALRKAPAKKKACRYGSASLASSLCVIREDALDARMIREAREADKGKARYTVNELRAQRGLAAI